MSKWFVQRQLFNGDTNPGSVSSLGVVAGGVLEFFVTASTTSTAGATATATAHIFNETCE